MLPTNYRLKKRSAFSATYHTGKVIKRPGLTVFIGKIKDNNTPTKIGFIVSKKTHKRAVKRNRIKRLMRESCRLLIKDGKINSKYMSLIFVGSKTLLDKDFKYVDRVIKEVVSKL